MTAPGAPAHAHGTAPRTAVVVCNLGTPDAPTPPPGAAEMPFLDHLEELRWRLVYSLAALAVGLVVAFALVSKVDVIGFLSQPVKPYLKPGQTLVYTHPGDVFGIVLNASLVLGLLIASPVIIYQVWAFLSPALYSHEKKVVIPVLLELAPDEAWALVHGRVPLYDR